MDLPEPFSVDFFSSPNVFVTCVLSQQLFYYLLTSIISLWRCVTSLFALASSPVTLPRFSRTLQAAWALCGLVWPGHLGFPARGAGPTLHVLWPPLQTCLMLPHGWSGTHICSEVLIANRCCRKEYKEIFLRSVVLYLQNLSDALLSSWPVCAGTWGAFRGAEPLPGWHS